MKFSQDIAFVNRLLGGDDTAAAEFQAEYYRYLCGAFKARCGDARSKTKAEEIAADVIADCFGANGAESLLSRYNGTSSLRGWLFVVGLNRLKSWWRSAQCRYEIAGQEVGENDALSQDEPNPARDELIGESEVVAILRRAFSVALRLVDTKDLDFLRAVYVYGFTQREVADMWAAMFRP